MYHDARFLKKQKELAALKPGKYLTTNKYVTRRGHYLDRLMKSMTVEFHPMGEKQKFKPGPARYLSTRTFKDELKAKGTKPQKKLDMTTERKG